MAESSHSFQDILKLMTTMSSFETLLDTANLDTASCIKLGIHEQFKTLHEKLSKYVHMTETEDLNFKCVCNICYEEVKIFNLDLKSSLAVHNQSELHKIVAKNKEMNQQCSDLKSDVNLKSSKLSMEKNNLSSQVMRKMQNDCSFTKNKDYGTKHNNLSDSKVQQPCTCQRAFCICGYGAKNTAGLEGKLSNLNLSHLGMQQILPMQFLGLARQPLQGQTTSQPKESKGRSHSAQRRPQKVQAKTAAPVANPSSQQSINIHVHMPTGSQGPAAGQSSAPQSTVPKSGNPRNNQNKKLLNPANLEKLRTRELADREEIQLMFKMVKEAEGDHWRRDNITKDGNEFDCKVCGNHMTSPYDLVKHTSGKTHQENLTSASGTKQNVPQNRNPNRNLLTEANMTKMRNIDLEDRAEVSLMWKMVKQAEGENWKRDHITRDDEEFDCNLCVVELNSPYQLLQHVQGKVHQKNLDNDSD